MRPHRDYCRTVLSIGSSSLALLASCPSGLLKASGDPTRYIFWSTCSLHRGRSKMKGLIGRPMHKADTRFIVALPGPNAQFRTADATGIERINPITGTVGVIFRNRKQRPYLVNGMFLPLKRNHVARTHY